MKLGAVKIWRVNGFRIEVRYSAWVGWTADYWQGGRRVSGFGDTMRELRQGVHHATSPGAVAKIAAMVPL